MTKYDHKKFFRSDDVIVKYRWYYTPEGKLMPSNYDLPADIPEIVKQFTIKTSDLVDDRNSFWEFCRMNGELVSGGMHDEFLLPTACWIMQENGFEYSFRVTKGDYSYLFVRRCAA